MCVLTSNFNSTHTRLKRIRPYKKLFLVYMLFNSKSCAENLRLQYIEILSQSKDINPLSAGIFTVFVFFKG